MKAMAEAGQTLFVADLALQVVEPVQEIQAQLGVDLIVAGIHAAQAFLRAGKVAKIQAVTPELQFKEFLYIVRQVPHHIY